MDVIFRKVVPGKCCICGNPVDSDDAWFLCSECQKQKEQFEVESPDFKLKTKGE